MISELKITIENLFEKAHRQETGKQRFLLEMDGEVDEEFLVKLFDFLKKEAPEVLPRKKD